MRTAVRQAANRLYFDAIMREEHTTTMMITRHPVEGGSDITDNSRKEPDTLVLEIMATDAGNGDGHSVNAYRSLRELQCSGLPMTVVTSLWTYKSMIIATLSAPRDYTSSSSVKAIVTFQEVTIVNTETVGVQGRSGDEQKTGNTSGGTKQGEPVDNSGASRNQSAIYEAAAGLFGG